MVIGWKPVKQLTNFVTSPNLDLWQVSEYSSGVLQMNSNLKKLRMDDVENKIIKFSYGVQSYLLSKLQSLVVF